MSSDGGWHVKLDVALMLAGVVGLWGARQYYRNWGATKDEGRAPMLGDGLVHEPAAESTAAEWIDASVNAVWPRVLDVVLGEHRTSGGANPSIGEEIRLPVTVWGRAMADVTMSVVDGADGRSLVLRTVHRAVPVDVTWAWLAAPRWDDRTRLIVRLRIALRHPGDVVVAEAAGPVLAILTRRRLADVRAAAMSVNAPSLPTTVVIPR